MVIQYGNQIKTLPFVMFSFERYLFSPFTKYRIAASHIPQFIFCALSMLLQIQKHVYFRDKLNKFYFMTAKKDLQQTGIYNSNGFVDYSASDRLHTAEDSSRRYQNLVQQNNRLKQSLNVSRNRSYSANCPNCNYRTDFSVREDSAYKVNEIVMSNIIDRNKFLEDKVEKLKGMYEKQQHTLRYIRNSEKWKNRFECLAGGSDCYEKKYFKLLRVRSPFY